MEAYRGPTAGFTDHFNFEPVDPAADPGTKSFCRRLLGSKPCGKALGGIPFPHAICPFRESIYTIQETFAKAIQRLLNPRNLDHVNAAAYDHAVYQANIRN
jgi:hypothetical protein